MPTNSSPLPLPASSYLEAAFVRWVLTPAVRPEAARHIVPQACVSVDGRTYYVDYEFVGEEKVIAVELDGFEFHGTRPAFTYDRLRQNDLAASGRTVVRFSYDAIRLETARCVAQLQSVLALDPRLRSLLVADPQVDKPDMDSSPLRALGPRAHAAGPVSYFDSIRNKINRTTLRPCQAEAFAALGNYFLRGGKNAACVMSVGAGKTALGVAAILAFTRRRALIVTPGSVIRGTFDRAFDHQAVGNALYGLPERPAHPRVQAAGGGDAGPGRRARSAASTGNGCSRPDVIITNFHSLGTGDGRRRPPRQAETEDIDLIVVDEAHIAAADSYQRLFRRLRRRQGDPDVGLLPATGRPADRGRRRLPLPAHRLDRGREREEPPGAAVRPRRRADHLRDGVARRPPGGDPRAGGHPRPPQGRAPTVDDHGQVARADPAGHARRARGPRPTEGAPAPGEAPRPLLRPRGTPRGADRADRRGTRHPVRLPPPLDGATAASAPSGTASSKTRATSRGSSS